MPEFALPDDLSFNRGPIADPEAFARAAHAASWLYLCGDEWATMDGGMSYAQVSSAVPESERIMADPPIAMDLDFVRQHLAADADDAPFTGMEPLRGLVTRGLSELADDA